MDTADVPQGRQGDKSVLHGDRGSDGVSVCAHEVSPGCCPAGGFVPGTFSTVSGDSCTSRGLP